jgi:hypothetical protein
MKEKSSTKERNMKHNMKRQYLVMSRHLSDDLPLRLFDSPEDCQEFAETFDPDMKYPKDLYLINPSRPLLLVMFTFEEGVPVDQEVLVDFDDGTLDRKEGKKTYLVVIRHNYDDLPLRLFGSKEECREFAKTFDPHMPCSAVYWAEPSTPHNLVMFTLESGVPVDSEILLDYDNEPDDQDDEPHDREIRASAVE